MSNRYVTTGEAAGQDEIHSITTTAEPHTKDMGHRMKVYATQMGLRVVCLLVFVAVDNFWVRAVALVGVAVLPWVAVMLANSGADRSARTSHYYEPKAAPALAALPEPAPDAEPLPGDLVLEGEFLPGHGDDDAARTAPGPDPAPSEDPASSATVEDDPFRRRGAA
jgi:hypothetical protein